jgi:glycerophosphoryl diester phosphodiesterase
VGSKLSRTAVLATAVVLAVPTSWAVQAPAHAVDPPPLPDVVYVAHRGGSLEVRENSMSGLQAAFDSGAVHGLELDTRQLSDGTVVVMHDATVDRVTSTTGPVALLTAAAWDLLRLDIGAWLLPPPEPEAPPRLSQVLDQFGGRTVLNIEAKNADSVDRIGAMVKARGLTGSTYVNTNDPAVARQIHELGLLTQLWRSAAQMRSDDPASFVPHVDLLDIDINATDADIARAVSSGVDRVWAHTLTTRAERDRALRLGVTGIITDAPLYLTGRTAEYPLVPTVIQLRTAPAPAQVSDPTTTEVVVRGESGPVIAEAPVTVRGAGLTATSLSSTGDLATTLRITTTGGRKGSTSVPLRVVEGGAGEKRWTDASLSVPLRLAGEDVEVRPRLTRTGRRLVIGARLRDSAATGYTGPRPETGAGRTPSDLHRARVLIKVRQAGRLVHRVRLRGADTGRPADGRGRVDHTWTAPRAGTYAVTVAVRGPAHAPASVVRRVFLG